ncbi:MAG: hypothetical protein HKN33_01740 [Pyrinomonadaceae bacterium]|nr:hypothetical protein [Pyrinomonadaceae bacterium]
MSEQFTIATFYEFVPLESLSKLKESLLELMAEHEVSGTIIVADEGFNSTVSGKQANLDKFLSRVFKLFGANPKVNFSTHDSPGFKRSKVKIKKEIVTLKKKVNMEFARGTHVSPSEWNKIILEPGTIVVDARNDYEYRIGTFKGARNPETESFSELPDYFEDRDPQTPIAMFCTGGIRCEKLAPYLVEKGFANVYQLEGGILQYLADTDSSESLWVGDCFVFDDRIAVDQDLNKGSSVDFSTEKELSRKKQ